VLPDLPFCIDDSSLTGRIRCVDGARERWTVTGIQVALEAAGGGENRAPDDAELKEAQLAEQHALDEERRLEQAMDIITALESPDRPTGRRGQAPPMSPTAARLALIEFRRDRLEALNQALGRQREVVRRAENRRWELEDRWNRASSDREPRPEELRKVARLNLRAEGEPPQGRYEIALEYRVDGARWAPAYGLDFSPDFASAVLSLRAQVAQATGEDWSGVSLRLSTAHAQRFHHLPELPGRRIGRRQPTDPKAGWRSPPSGAADLLTDYQQALAATDGLRLRRERDYEVQEDDPPDAVMDLLLDEETVGQSAEPLQPMAAAARVYAGMAANELGTDVETALRPADVEPVPAAPPAPKLLEALARVSPKAATPPPVEGRAIEAAEARTRTQPMARRPGAGAALRARSELLDYGRLRLAGPGADPATGQLHRIDPVSAYQELSQGLRMVAGREAAELFRAALEPGRTLHRKALPAGCSPPQAMDHFDHAYEGDGSADVPSDGRYHSVTVMERPAQPSLRYVAVPRASAEVYRFVRFENPLSSPLPAGPVDVYVNGEYLRTSPLRSVPVGGRVDMGLGVEASIKIARNTRFQEASGALGTRTTLSHRSEIEIENLLGQPADMEVRERVPTIRQGDEDLSIDIDAAEPEWEPFEQEQRPIQGGYRWRLALAPGERTRLRAGYELKLKAKLEIAGGNRREG
jgi:hypothetical protein